CARLANTAVPTATGVSGWASSAAPSSSPIERASGARIPAARVAFPSPSARTSRGRRSVPFGSGVLGAVRAEADAFGAVLGADARLGGDRPDGNEDAVARQLGRDTSSSDGTAFGIQRLDLEGPATRRKRSDGNG